jgi:hypothetical protein
MTFHNGQRVTFTAEDGKTYEGTYAGVIQPYEYKHHAIHVDGFPEANWVRVGSEREDTIKPVQL